MRGGGLNKMLQCQLYLSSVNCQQIFMVSAVDIIIHFYQPSQSDLVIEMFCVTPVCLYTLFSIYVNENLCIKKHVFR